MTSNNPRPTGTRLSVVAALVAAFTLLFVGGASAQSGEDCYPVPVDGCEEPEVQPSVVESPVPAPEPTREVAQQVDDTDDGDDSAAAGDTDDAVLASTGIESPVLGAIAAGLVAAGAGAVVVARRRETVDA